MSHTAQPFRIMKRHQGNTLIFQADAPNDPTPTGEKYTDVGWIPLHHHDKRETDFDYLQKYFPPDSPIFERFGESYFYIQTNE